MDLESHLDFLARHPYAVGFWSSLIEAAGVFFSRFSTSVRLFASACAGCAELTYVRYLVFDATGTVGCHPARRLAAYCSIHCGSLASALPVNRRDPGGTWVAHQNALGIGIEGKETPSGHQPPA